MTTKQFVNRRIGVLGGGQLGKMLSSAAHKLGLTMCVVDPTPDCPCHGFVDKHIVGKFTDPEQVKLLQQEGCEVITVEIEHVNIDSLEDLVKSGTRVEPSPATLRIIQDKYVQKQYLEKHNIPITPFLQVNSAQELDRVIEQFGFPFLLKSRKLAYDGRGNYVVHTKDDFANAFSKLGNSGLYAEKFVNFTKELSVMVARGLDGTIASYPVVETIHVDNICHTVIAPAEISASKARALLVAEHAVKSLEGAGVFGIELFLTDNNEILLNEIAPRPHNSGHYTIEACETCQYEQHIRAIMGLPLGSTDMKVNSAIMRNVLGTGEGDDELQNTLQIVNRALGIKGASVHWYGKKEVKKQRKMGHIVITGHSMHEVHQKLLQIDPNNQQTYALKPLVGIIMGSDSDLPKMKAAAEILHSFDIPFEVTIVSAHRTPDRMFQYAKNAHVRGLHVIIAGAGGAAHLPGMVAALTPLPVIGVPIRIEPLDGHDVLMSIVQMPRGVPVATVAINNSTNAGLLAARIIGCQNSTILAKMVTYQDNMRDTVLEKVETLDKVGWEKYS